MSTEGRGLPKATEDDGEDGGWGMWLDPGRELSSVL